MLRFPEGMRAQIKAAAEENGRTMNAEIVSRLQRSFDPAPVDLKSRKLIGFSKEGGVHEQTLLESLAEIRDQVQALSGRAEVLYAVVSGEADKQWIPQNHCPEPPPLSDIDSLAQEQKPKT